MNDFAETKLLDGSGQPLRPPALQQPGATPSPIRFPRPFKSRLADVDREAERAAADKRRGRDLQERLADAHAAGVAKGLRQKADERVITWMWGAGTGLALGATLTLLVVKG